VLTGEGLVGRVLEAGQRVSRVLLITDLNSRIPVRIERTRVRAILVGDNTDRPLLEYLPSHDVVAPGDRVVTSGDAGVFPPGLAIGEVVAVTETGVRVRPFVDWNRLELVRVADFALPGILDDFRQGSAEAAAGPALPRASNGPVNAEGRDGAEGG
jgi:rod shape-determining protein MreC